MNPVTKLKICQSGADGFGHQLEGMLRVISLSLNNKAEYMYNFKKQFSFEHTNFNLDTLNSYLLNALGTLSNGFTINGDKKYKDIYNEQREFKQIIESDPDYLETIYCYDGVGCGRNFPPNFECIDELEKSLPTLRNAFVLKNPLLPKPSYDTKVNNIVCHIRLGDAVGTRSLENDRFIDCIKEYQKNPENHITIHSNGDIDYLKSKNVTICNKDTDVLQILSDFIHANIFIMNNSSLSVAAHLLADTEQIVFCPALAEPIFYKRILNKCKRLSYKSSIENKRYSWENDTITFLENGQMDAYGKGYYIQKGNHTFDANFGYRMHSLVFNDDYTEYTSTRYDDNQVIKGKLL